MPERVAKATQIFFLDVPYYRNDLAMRTAVVTDGEPIAV
jgi:hypothetical protein